ncbi:MAG TPA: phosphoribosyltransferase [bacterium (Candidatus Stahlbacteria)]|nr:phosphoribosyltransferase [Candidatus Stahlbacteria bacterium]
MDLHELNDTERLVVLDHWRFFLLQIFQIASYRELVLGHPWDIPSWKTEIRQAILETELSYLKTLLGLSDVPDFHQYHNRAPWFIDLTGSISSFLQDVSFGDLASRAVRGIIEADHPLFNLAFAERVSKLLESEDIDVIVGLHYGGIRLPFTISALHELIGNRKRIELYSAHFSQYSLPANTSQIPESTAHPFTTTSVAFDVPYLTGRKVLLVDDGAMSGISLLNAMLFLYSYGADRVYPAVVSVPGDRRIAQMVLNGGINPNFLGRLSPHAVGVSPFARAQTLGELEEKDNFNLVKARVRQRLGI